VEIVTRKPDFPWRRLGELLLERDLVDAADLESALAVQASTGRRLGEILVTRGALSAQELIGALADQHGLQARVGPLSGTRDQALREWQPLGRILVERGSLGRATLKTVLLEQRRTGRRLGSILVDGGHVTAVELVEALVEQHGLAPHEVVATTAAPPSAEPGYEVVAGDGPPVFRTDGFLDATDFAFELLETDEPDAIRIYRVDGENREEIWSYTAERAAETAAAARRSVEIYGFDVARWTDPTRR
jgi:hypothetical protein